jgi:hypothetical protein
VFAGGFLPVQEALIQLLTGLQEPLVDADAPITEEPEAEQPPEEQQKSTSEQLRDILFHLWGVRLDQGIEGQPDIPAPSEADPGEQRPLGETPNPSGEPGSPSDEALLDESRGLPGWAWGLGAFAVGLLTSGFVGSKVPSREPGRSREGARQGRTHLR